MKPRKNPLGDMNIVGANVTRIRTKKNMKQKELLAKLQAAEMDINASSLSKLEGQTRMVSDRELKILAKCLKVTADDLLSS